MIHSIYSNSSAHSIFNWRALLSFGVVLIALAMVILFFPEILIAFIAAILLFTGIGIVAMAIILRRSERTILHRHSYPMM